MRSVNGIYLASASPRRLELLRSLGLNVEVVPSDYGEPDNPALTPRELAQHHARAKLRDVVAKLGPTFDRPTLAADTVVDRDGTALNKPQDDNEAHAMLASLSGREHVVHTAVAIALPGGGAAIEFCESTRVRFHQLGHDEIDEYVASGEPFDKAGGYGIQGRAAALVSGIEGDFYTVMGLPLGRVVRTLRAHGYRPEATDAAHAH